MNFGMISLNQSTETKQNYATWIMTALLFIIKPKIFYEDIANDVKEWFDTSNYDEDDKRPLPIGRNKLVIVLFKDEFGQKITKEFVAIRAKTWPYLTDDNSEHKKSKGTKMCVIKREPMFKNYKDCQSNDKIILKSQQRFKSDHHNVYTEQINTVALSSNDDKRLQTFDKITTYPHRKKFFKVCESEMLAVMKYKELVLNNTKKTNEVFKEIVTRCQVNRSIRFPEGEMFMVMEYKDFLLDNENDIKKTDRIFKAIVAKCMVNRSNLFREASFEK